MTKFQTWQHCYLHWPVLYLTIQGKQTFLNTEVRDEKHLKYNIFWHSAGPHSVTGISARFRRIQTGEPHVVCVFHIPGSVSEDWAKSRQRTSGNTVPRSRDLNTRTSESAAGTPPFTWFTATRNRITARASSLSSQAAPCFDEVGVTHG